MKKNLFLQLKQLGFEIDIVHRRWYDGEEPQLLTKAQAFGLFGNVVSTLPKGGETTATIKTPDNIVVNGVAKCSKEDPYNRRLGLNKALGRALQELIKVEKQDNLKSWGPPAAQ
jgi:hypothetical protein